MTGDVSSPTAGWDSQTEELRAEVQRHAQTGLALRASERRLTSCLHFAGVAAWSWNSSSDEITWSGAVERVYGVPPDLIRSHSQLRGIIHPDDLEQVDSDLRQAVEQKTDFRAEFRVVYPGKEPRWLSVWGGPQQEADGSLTLLGVTVDATLRKATQLNLQASEEQFRQMAEAMRQIIWTANPAGEFEYYNQNWYDITGFSRTVHPRDCDRSQVLHRDDFERWLATWSEALSTGETYEIEYRFRDVREGEYRWYLGRGVPLRDGNGKITRWIGSCTDIHKRKVAELQIAASEAKLRKRDAQLSMVFRSGTIGDWSWDIEKDEVNAHPMVWAMYGDPGFQGPAPSGWFAERQHPDDLEHIRDVVRRALSGDGSIAIEFRVIHPDRSIRWLSMTGAVVWDEASRPKATFGLTLDITERKTAELQTLENERRLQRQADAMPQIVWTCKPDGSPDYFNRRWYEYTGDAGQLTESQWKSFIDPADLDHFCQARSDGLAAGKPFEMEFRLRQKSDGTYRWNMARCLPYFDKSDSLNCWFCTSTDIHDQKTERDRLEEEVRLRTEDLRRSLKEKETLLKEVHHRVKNNLQVVSSLLRMQADALQDQGAVLALKDSQQRVLSMALIHERLYGSQQMDRIDFAEYAHALVRELFYSYGTRTEHVTSKFDTSGVLLSVDQAIPCGLILNELVSNALKYAYPDGRSGEVKVELSEVNGTVRLAVSDQGVGLPAGLDCKNLKSLGLPIVDLLAKQLGGNLIFGSDHGAAFTVEFAQEEHRRAAPAA